MRRDETAAPRADESFEGFARLLLERAGDWLAAHADLDRQLDQLRAVLVDGTEARAQASAHFLQGWRALSDAGSAALAPLAGWSTADVALGPQREQRESGQRLQQHTARLQQAFDHLSTLLATLPAQAFAQFAARARERAVDGRPFENLRAVYDAWIESSEAAYAALAHAAAFGSAQSALNDAFLALRAEQQAWVERAARHFDLPTRGEMDNVHRQLRALRREVGALRAAKARVGKSAKARATAPAPRVRRRAPRRSR